ncbi:MAG: 3-hydroxyacyl-ACP dehydratase FabZ family protein [Planctomycetota bacterium]
MPPPPIYDLSKIDFDDPVYTLDDIRAVNGQRHEMEQLTAIVVADADTQTVVGYKDITENEFWCRGHFPDFPIMPGVIQCEVAAQLASFFSKKHDLLQGSLLGFGGMDGVRFRAPVYPNSRLVLAARLLKLRQGRQATFEFQGFVGEKMVFSGQSIGVPLKAE